MPNLSLNVNTDKYQSGTTTSTCPKCQHNGDMERWTTTKSYRFFGIPLPINRSSESLKCTACGKSHKA